MFKTRRLLNAELDSAHCEIERLNKEIEILRGRLQAFNLFDKSTPDDCNRGDWCHGCQFNKMVHIPGRHIMDEPIRVSFCDRGNICNNFI